MRKLLLFFGCLLAAAINLLASDYVPLIEQGKVWEYIGPYWRTVDGQDEYGNVHHFMKFDGTVTVNEQIYSKFYLYHSDYYKSTGIYEELVMAESKDRRGAVAYLREEGKQVYILTKDEDIYFTRESEETLEGNVTDESFGEFLRYDFSLKDGDTFYIPDGNSVIPSELMPMTVRVEEPIEVAGVPCVTYSLIYQHPEYTYGNSSARYDADLTAGLGVLRDGDLANYGGLRMSGKVNNIDSPRQGSSLLRVYAPDGTLMYGNPPQSPSADYVQMIKEGRVWEYSGDYFLPDEYGMVRHFMKFDEDITVNGKDYTSFVLFKSDFYKAGNGNIDKCDRTEMRNGPRFFVREENGKVYVLTNDSHIYYTTADSKSDWITSESDSFNYEEFAIYDFTAAEGSEAPLLMDCEVFLDNTGLSVNWLSPVTEWGVKYRAYQFVFDFDPEVSTPGNAIVIEGIGITVNGHLASFDSYMNTAIFNDNYLMPGQGSCLVSVREANGEYIYGEPSFDGVATVSADLQKDQTIYDVMGRQVKETVPGSIYIRGGKKFVAK